MLRATIEVDYTGLRGLVTTTKERSATLKAVKAGARVVQPAMKAAAPRRAEGGGSLRQAIGIKAVKGTVGQTKALAVLGPRRKVVKFIPRGNRTVKAVPANYGHLADQGTRPHAVGKGARLGRAGKVATFGRKKGRVVGAVAATAQAGGLHPGAKATKFMERAWSANRAAAGRAAVEVMSREIQKAIAKEAARVPPKRKA